MAVIYDASPERAQVPLDSAEVEALLLTDGGEFSRDRGKLRHLLLRMRATLLAHVRALRARQREFDELVEQVGVQRDPVEAAVEALGRCTSEEQAQVYDRAGQVLVWQAREAQQLARQAFIAGASDTNRARAALVEAVNTPGMPEEARERLVGLVEQLPVVNVPNFVEPAHSPGGFNIPPAAPDSQDL